MLDLYTMLQQGQEIWAQNRTNPLGVLVLSMPTGSSGPEGRPFSIPASKDPICLSMVFTEDELRRSQDLRNLTLKNALILITKEQAHAWFRSAGKPVVPMPSERKSVVQEAIRNEPEATPVTTQAAITSASPQTIQMTLSLQHPSLTDDQVIEVLQENMENMDTNDIAYVMSQIGRKKVSSWLAQTYIARDEESNEEEAPEDSEPSSETQKAQKPRPMARVRRGRT